MDVGPARHGKLHGWKKALIVYAAAYETVQAALAGLDAIEQLHEDELIGQYDAAVIDQEHGRPHVVAHHPKAAARPTRNWVIDRARGR